MSEKNPFVVQALLFYIYKGTYHDSPVNEIDQDSALALDVQIYHAAHEYQMDELKQLATSKVMRLVGSIANPNAVDELGFYKGVELAYHNHHLHELGEELTPRKALTCACARDFSHLKHYDGVQRALREVPDFAADVLYWKC